MYFDRGGPSIQEIVYVARANDNVPDWALLETSPIIDDVMDVEAQQHGDAHVNTFGDLSEGNNNHDSSVSAICKPPGSTLMSGDNGELSSHGSQLLLESFSEEIGNVDDILLVAPPTQDGSAVPVTMACALGTCRCQHELDRVACQLYPCRFAFLIYGGLVQNPDDFRMVYEGVCDGFRIVDTEVTPYVCENYLSILSDQSRPQMDSIIKHELAEGYLSVTDQQPVCIHALLCLMGSREQGQLPIAQGQREGQ